MKIQVAYVATLEEYYEANDSFRQALNKKSVDFYMVLTLGIIALAFMLMGHSFIGATIAIIAFILQQGYVGRWIVRRNFNQITHKGETEVLIFSRDGIIYKCGMVSEKIGWDEYAAYLETDNLFLLFYNASDYYVIVPKRAITNEQELEVFRQLLIEQLANYIV